MRQRWIVVGLAALLACASPGGVSQREAERDLAAGRGDVAAQKLERARDAAPRSVEIRVDLAHAYYLQAREALEGGREADYATYIEKAQNELLTAAEIDPESSDVHLWMGIILAYQNDIHGAIDSFTNAKKLAPGVWVHTTNLAETWIYAGNVARARTLLDRARKQGAPPAVIEMNEVLAAWKQGDYVEARDIFDGVYALDPSVVRNWNVAPVGERIESFGDFTKFCCDHVACGPYMANACKEMDLHVAERELQEETLRKELEMAAERRRRLKEIYDKRGDLEIKVED
jgi:tetratricopeptide (TPR) repeat protein